MRAPIRFPYRPGDPGRSSSTPLPYLPIVLRYGSRSVLVSGLMDTGSTVNVLPYAIGLQLGLVWEEQKVPIHLTGNLARLPAHGVVVTGEVEPFPPIKLAFAWSRADDTPIILGQTNFFMEFDVCFYRADFAFDLKPRSA